MKQELSYASAGKPRVNSDWIILGVLLLVAVLSLSWAQAKRAGMRLVGFKYSVPVDNRLTECPNQVVAVAGNRITLDDGRVLHVADELPADHLMAELDSSEKRVRFDSTTQMLYVGHRVLRCGFSRPERGQYITILLLEWTC